MTCWPMVMGAVLVATLSAGITGAVGDHPELSEELVVQVDLDNINFASNDELKEVLSTTTATPAQIDEAVELNAQQISFRTGDAAG